MDRNAPLWHPLTERLEREIRETLAQLDVPPVEDPLTEPQKLGGEMLAWKEAIGRKVNVLLSLRYEGVGTGGLPEPFDAPPRLRPSRLVLTAFALNGQMWTFAHLEFFGGAAG